MIRLLTAPVGEVIDDLVTFCLDHHRPGGRRLLLNMVTSLDGATAAGGETAPLSDDDDRALFVALRAAADVVLVGAGTVREEDYGPIRLPVPAQEARRARGLSDLPRLAVVSRSLDLDPSARLFSDPSRRPYLLTGEASPLDRRERLASRADVVTAGEAEARPGQILDFFFDRGHEVILCEGGPSLNGELVAEDLVDEFNVTLAPVMVGGPSSRLVRRAPLVSNRFRLERLMAGERMLFARYLRDRP